MPEFIQQLRENENFIKSFSDVRIENSGYITFVDMTPEPVEDANLKDKKKGKNQ